MARLLECVVILAGLTILGFGWSLYFWRHDPGKREPPLPLAITFGLGVLAGVLCGWYRGATSQSFAWMQGWLRSFGFWRALAEATLRIGLVEELAKFLPVWIYSRRSGYFDEAGDGLVYATTSAVGFATAEAAAILGTGLRSVRLLGLLALPVTHGLFSATWGWGVGRTVLHDRWSPVWIVAGLAVASLTHGLYDVVLFRVDIPNPTVVALVLALWLWFMKASAPARPEFSQSGGPDVRSDTTVP